jgi:Protein of unknown function (DUF3606)
MTDDKTNRSGKDRNRINLNEGYEVQYWTKTLGVSRDRLEEGLVRQHGDSAKKIREVLGKQAA